MEATSHHLGMMKDAYCSNATIDPTPATDKAALAWLIHRYSEHHK